MEITATNFIVDPSNIKGDRLILTGSEAKHLLKTLRAGVGDSFYAIDGSGKKYRALIESTTGLSVTGLISSVSRLENEPCHSITLAMGICRPPRMDEVVEKGTETGVSSFLFYYSEKSYSKGNEEISSPRKVARLKRIARAASKQSKRSLIPSVPDPVTFKDMVSRVSDFDLSLMAISCQSSLSIDDSVDRSKPAKNILLLVGPESGFTNDEIALAIDSGFLPVSLGPRRLRAETAGVIFPALILNYLGDL